MLTASDDGTARVFDARGGGAVAVFRGHTDTVNRAVFSPDGRLVLTASDDRTARLWDPSKAVAVLRGTKAASGVLRLPRTASWS